MPFPPSHAALDLALSEQGYAEPTPVQAAVLEDGARDRDLLVSAQTGSGKTVAFGLAFASSLIGEAPRLPPTRPLDQGGAPLALIIAPTRELALQVSRELTWLYAKAGAVIATCVGGMDPRKEQRALAFGCHIVVGTPGRLCDHLERGNLDLSGLKVVVLDEADEMLDLGFREDLEVLLDAAPAERRTLLFSATIAKDIAALARRYQRDAVRIDTINRDEPHRDIDYRAIRVAPNEVEKAVVNVLRYFEGGGAMVFCSTREAVRHLYMSLRERGFAAVALSGELSQKERTDALQALRDGHAKVCVATDVAARGLDLPDLALVVHADLPVNRAGLLHRSGRTGRAGRKGVSVLMVPYPRRRRAEQLLASANIEAAWANPPTAEEIRQRDQQRLIDDPMLAEPAAEEDLGLARALLEARGAEQIAAALIRLHRASTPAPEELFDAPADDFQRRERGKPYDPAGRERAPVDYARVENGAWYRLPVGRSANADPKWLIPLICRLGHVTKKDIGQIRIFDRETKFEIAPDAEARFTAALKSQSDEKMRIEPAGAPTGKGAPPRGGRPPHKPDRRGPPPKSEDRRERPPARPERGDYKGKGKNKGGKP
ncbi:DEAD/DEAH box helicase [Phenylobacterium montanum]|uniref:DEAD/DEAH box helicase n=1 Tax=Phenylobacterium montanum TaxID=2823693 RepID=A0A975IUJ6_9CAUL|nr:DEAD/DEAH box helicase [Caulobacter sp. S6]